MRSVDDMNSSQRFVIGAGIWIVPFLVIGVAIPQLIVLLLQYVGTDETATVILGFIIGMIGGCISIFVSMFLWDEYM